MDEEIRFKNRRLEMNNIIINLNVLPICFWMVASAYRMAHGSELGFWWTILGIILLFAS